MKVGEEKVFTITSAVNCDEKGAALLSADLPGPATYAIELDMTYKCSFASAFGTGSSEMQGSFVLDYTTPYEMGETKLRPVGEVPGPHSSGIWIEAIRFPAMPVATAQPPKKFQAKGIYDLVDDNSGPYQGALQFYVRILNPTIPKAITVTVTNAVLRVKREA